MRTIYVIGFMGAGKTSVGESLAELLGLVFHDTDEEIVQQTGKSIQQLFAEDGEEYFRKLESRMLTKLPTRNAIVSTGGGIILSEANRRWMRMHGQVVFLHAAPEVILERLKNDTTRPLLASGKEKAIYSLYEKRLPLYEKTAHLRVETAGKSIGEIAQEAENRLKKEK